MVNTQISIIMVASLGYLVRLSKSFEVCSDIRCSPQTSKANGSMAVRIAARIISIKMSNPNGLICIRMVRIITNTDKKYKVSIFKSLWLFSEVIYYSLR